MCEGSRPFLGFRFSINFLMEGVGVFRPVFEPVALFLLRRRRRLGRT